MRPAESFPIDVDTRTMLDQLQHDTFRYFLHEVDAASGLALDSTAPGSHTSIAAVGLALSSYPVGVERGFLTRDEAAARTVATLRFFWNAPQGRNPMRRDIAASSTTSSKCGPGDARGSASSPRWTPRSSSPGR